MDMKEIYSESTRHFLRPILHLIDDPDVSEILVNGPHEIYAEKAGKLQRVDAQFKNQAVLMAGARNIAEYAGRSIDDDNHSMDARLPDGSRVHVIVPPCARNGVCLSIRKFNPATFDLQQLVEWESISEVASEFLSLCVKMHRNLVVAGGTGSGKTSLLNALSGEIASDERIIVIEDSTELKLRQPHTLYLETRPARPDGGGSVTIRDLFVDSLRMRPDRIIVGEVRRGEALDLIQSMISGHAGSMTTVHATTARDAAVRLETLSLMSDVAIPAHVARVQVASAIQVVVQISRFMDGSRRVHAISECLGLDRDNEYRFQDLFRFKPIKTAEGEPLRGELVPTGNKASFGDQLELFGLESQVRTTKEVWDASSE